MTTAALGPSVPETVDILLVDDRPENLTALCAVLERPDYRLVTASSGPEALVRLAQSDFAVILLDAIMPGMSGFELAPRIRARERWRDTPIIFLTAAGGEDAIRMAYEVGAVDYLCKPIEPQVVRAKVAVFADLFRKGLKLREQAELLRRTDQREREGQLADLREASEKRYRNLADAIPHIVWMANPEGAFDDCNQRWTEYTGLSREQSRGWGWLAAVHPDDGGCFTTWRRAVQEAGAFQAECRLRRGWDGEFRWHLCKVLPEAGQEGKLLAWLGTFTDIDDQKRAEESRTERLTLEQAARAAAEAAQKRFEFLAEASSQLSASLDYRTTLASVARLAVPRLADWCIVYMVEEDGTIRRLAVAHHDVGSERIAADMRQRANMTGNEVHPVVRAVQTGGPQLFSSIGEAELEALTSEAVGIDTLRGLGLRSLMVVPLKARGRVLGAISLSSTRPDRSYGPQDLVCAEELAAHAALAVDNARLYREANDAIRARDEFLSIASHELRTPLTALQLQVQSIGRGLRRRVVRDEAGERANAKIQIAERQLERLGRLVEELLDVSRITGGRLRLEPEILSLANLATDVVTRMGEEVRAAGCTMALRPDPAAIGSWDKLRIEQVVTNLIANAIKYGPGKLVEVTIEVSQGRAILSVRDHGIGIPPAAQERIFERFGRAVPARDYPGLGLGLYIAREIVLAHRGDIRVLSAPGHGATFMVELPLDRPNEAAVAPAKEEGAA